MLPFMSTSFVSLLPLCLCCCRLGEAGKIVITLSPLCSPPQYIVHSYACVGVQVHVHFHVCVAEMGLAEMSKARSHAVSGGADIALAVGGLQGAMLASERIVTHTPDTHIQ